MAACQDGQVKRDTPKREGRTRIEVASMKPAVAEATTGREQAMNPATPTLTLFAYMGHSVNMKHDGKILSIRIICRRIDDEDVRCVIAKALADILSGKAEVMEFDDKTEDALEWIRNYRLDNGEKGEEGKKGNS